MRPPLTKVLQTFALLIGAMALVFSSAGFAGATSTQERPGPENAQSNGNNAQNTNPGNGNNGSSGNGDNAGDDAEVDATLECGVLTATSTKDISNLVLEFEDGTSDKLDGLSGLSYEVDVDADYPGQTLVKVFVKSGNNGDGTDNGVGEEVSVTDTGTDCEPGTGEGTNPDTGQDGDDGQDGAPGEDGQDGAPGEDGVDAPQVEGDVVQNPVTPVTPATPAQPGVNPAAPASPAVLNASDRNPQVLGAQTVRTLPRTGAGTNNLVPFGLGLVLLGFAIQRKSKTLSAARVR